MSLLVRLRRALAEPRLQGLDVDSDALITVHREILGSKPMLEAVFREIYDLCRAADEHHFIGSGPRIELGAGSSRFRDVHPDVLTSDVKHARHLDLTLDAEALGLAASSVRAFYAIHCFHHLRDPDRFFAELARVLEPGGGCVLVEPYYGPLAGIFYRRVFDTEHFDPRQSTWTTPVRDGAGPMSDANQALSYIVFERDAERLRRMHPALEVVERRRLPNAARYLLSGGLNFRQLVPTALAPMIRTAERLLAPIDHLHALHHMIVLRKVRP